MKPMTSKPANAGMTPPAPKKTAEPKESLGVKDGVGFVAGDIYAHLYKKGEATLNDLKTELKQTPAMLGMAVGWLAREN
jgi:hypothetical protein